MDDEKDAQKFEVRKRVKSFKYAFSGIALLFRHEHNSRIHLAAAVVVSIAGFCFHIGIYKWLAVVFAIGLVFMAEILNSAIEHITDIISPEYNHKAGQVKDLAAGAVLLASVTALVIGVIVFVPEIIKIIR